MFRSAVEVMKIVFKGFEDIGDNCRSYMEKGMLKSYEQWKADWEEKLPVLEDRREAVIKCKWETAQAEKHIVLDTVILAILMFVISYALYSTGDEAAAVFIDVLLALLYIWRINSLFKRRFRMTARREWLEREEK